MLNQNPKITAAGLAMVAAAAATPGKSVAITAVAIGSQSYTPNGNEKALKLEFGRFPVNGGTLPGGTQVQVNFTIKNTDLQNRSTSSQWVGEVGFYAGDTLFAVLSKPEPAFFYKSQDIDIPIAYSLDISALPADSVTVNASVAPNVLQALLAGHELKQNAHPDIVAALALETARSAALLASETAKVQLLKQAAEAARDAALMGQSAGVIGKDTLANLNADLAYPDKTIAYVTNDAVTANNTTYRKTGASGAGAWVVSSASPIDVLRAVMTSLISSGATFTDDPFMIMDDYGNAALIIQSDGTVRVPLLAADVLKPKELTFPASSTSDQQAIDFEYAICDSFGAIAFGIRANGEVYIGNLKAPSTVSTAPTYQTLTLDNSDTIANIGDSYTASHYALKDKAYISILSALSPYRHQNFGISGNDALDMNYRIINNSPYFDGKTFSDMRPKYSLIAAYTNDGQFWQANVSYFKENLCRLVETVRSVGSEPILCTEFPQTATDRGVHRAVATQYGLRYVDSSPFTAELGGMPAGPFMQGHPGTRNNGIFWIDMLREVDALPRPDKGIKIFRRRAGFIPSNISDLLYKTRIDRMEKWKELSLTQYRLSDATQQYYDELNGQNVYDHALTKDEYWILQKKQPINFADYALIEITLPGTAATLDEVRLNLGIPETATVYVRNYMDTASSIPGRAKGATPTLPEYLAKWNLPRGAWMSLGTYSGAMTLSNTLRGAMEGDVLTVLVHNVGGFDLTDVSIDYRGPLGKPARPPALPRFIATGPELLGKAGCSAADLAAWSVRGSPVTLVPVDRTSAPRDPENSAQPVAGVCVVTSVNTIGQTVMVVPGTSGKRIRLSVWARHFPKAFLSNSGAGSYNLDPAQVIDRVAAGITFTDSLITPDTFDLRTLRVEWCFGPDIPTAGGVQMDDYACLSWRAIEFDIDVPPAPQAGISFTFRLSCPDGQIQIAKASFKECN